MADIRDVVPTRSALLELRQERSFVADGREFLDKKRLLLAGRALRCFADIKRERARLESAETAARSALGAALGRHGLDEIWHRPIGAPSFRLEIGTDHFLGIPQITAELSSPDYAPPEPINPSPEAGRCRRAFREILFLAARIAALENSLERLLDEYRKTQRRVRALENVVLPELERTVRHLDEQLDGEDREEMLRARLAG